MRRLVIILSATALVLGVAPAGALARHHHERHHKRVRHARTERFGRDVTSAPSTSNDVGNAGTVQSFQNGRLTMMLGDGSTVTGAVTNDTEIECAAPGRENAVRHDRNDGSGDQSGDGEDHGGSDDQSPGSGDHSSGEDRGDAGERTAREPEDQNEDQAEPSCSTSNLTPGTVVREAVLRISGSGSAWTKVELGS
jgi:hypothetical protein